MDLVGTPEMQMVAIGVAIVVVAVTAAYFFSSKRKPKGLFDLFDLNVDGFY